MVPWIPCVIPHAWIFASSPQLFNYFPWPVGTPASQIQLGGIWSTAKGQARLLNDSQLRGHGEWPDSICRLSNRIKGAGFLFSLKLAVARMNDSQRMSCQCRQKHRNKIRIIVIGSFKNIMQPTWKAESISLVTTFCLHFLSFCKNYLSVEMSNADPSQRCSFLNFKIVVFLFLLNTMNTYTLHFWSDERKQWFLSIYIVSWVC